MRRCGSPGIDIDELVFGETEGETGLEIHEHLEACAMCREEERELIRMRETLVGPERPVSPVLRTRWRVAITAGGRAGSSSWLSHPVPAWGAVLGALGLVALALAAPRVTGQWADRRAQAAPSRIAGPGSPDSAPPFATAGAYDIGVRFAGPAESTRVVFPRDRDRDSL
jgi:hypothetical protein